MARDRTDAVGEDAQLKLVAKLERLLRFDKHEELCRELMRLELAGELGECYALCLHARLAIKEKTEFALDYLQMAESVATSLTERRCVEELRGLYDLARKAPVRTGRAGWSLAVDGWSPVTRKPFNA